MGKYITRVQIKDAVEADYEKLDIEMKKGFFVRIKKAGAGNVLPGAQEYKYSGVRNIQAVITAAYTAASRIGKQYSLTVMKERRAVPA